MNAKPTERTEVGSADVSLFTEPNHYDEDYLSHIVVPTDDDVDVFDLGDLVADRIEANGKATFPDDRPAEGERQPLGTVYWDERGIPTRLVRDDDVVLFTEDGGVDDVRETKTLGFEVYRDDSDPSERSDAFAVLTNPGPDTPRGALETVQDAVDDSDLDLENGEGGPAGTVEYVPGKDEGFVVDVDVDGGSA